MPLDGGLAKGKPSAHAFLRGDDLVGGRRGWDRFERGPCAGDPCDGNDAVNGGATAATAAAVAAPSPRQTAARPVANQQLQLQLHRDEAAEHRLKWTGAVELPSTGSARPPCPGSAALPEVQSNVHVP